MSDLSKLSDADLMAALQAPPPDISKMSDDDLRAALGKTEKPSVVQDVVNSAGSGLLKGAIGVAGMPADVARGLGAFVDSVHRGGHRVLGLPDPDLSTIQKNPVAEALGSHSLRKGFEDITGSPLYEPKTTAGKYASTAAEFVPASGGGIANAIRFGIAPGLASEAAGQATEGTRAEPFARAGAAIATGGAAALLQRPNTVGQTLAEGLQGVTRDQVNGAMIRMSRANEQGVPLTWAEALAQETNGATTRLSNVARVVEESADGGRVMGPFFAERPGQVAEAGRREITALAPGAETDPVRLGLQAQRAGEGALATVRGERSAATRPFYEAAANDRVAPDRMEGLIRQLDTIIAGAPTPELAAPAAQIRAQLIERAGTPGTPASRTPVTEPNTGRVIRYESTPATPATPDIPQTNVGRLDTVYGQARDDFTGPPPLGETGSQARARRSGAEAAGLLDAELRNASPSLREGRRVHGEMSERLVNPVEAGPVGAIGKTEDVGQQTAALFPARPQAGASVPVADAVRRLAAEDPRAAAGLVRQHAMTTFAETTQANMGGPNQAGGAKFAATIAGNPEQYASLRAAVEELPNGAQRWQGFENFLETMEATGRRLPANSATAVKTEIRDELSKGGAAGEAASLAAGGLFQLPKRVREGYQSYRYGLNTEQIARVLTDPLTAPMLVRLATEPRGSALATQITGRLATIATTARDPFGAQ